MTAPQITYIVLTLASLLCSALLHGKPKSGKHNFPIDFVGMLFGFLLLLWGGFFR